MKTKLILLFLFFSSGSFAFASWQCLSVRGTVTCGRNGTIGDHQIFMQLIDYDHVSSSDLMDEGYAGKHGNFYLSGCASDPMGNIDPQLMIYHKCKGSPKLVTIIVPDAAIDHEFKYVEVINMDRQFRDEKNYNSPVPRCTHRPPSSEGGHQKFYYF